MFYEVLIVFIIGLCVGSFLNVVVFRTHKGEDLVKGRSKCQSCSMPLKARDLIPVVSYIALRARCRGCKTAISWQYPLVEVATGMLFVLMVFRIPMGMTENLGLQRSLVLIFRDWVFVSYLALIFVYDLRHMLILDRFTLPAIVFAIIVNLWLGIISVPSLLIGGVVLGGFFWLQFALSKGKWVGGGDIRLGVLMGVMLGLEQGLVALFLAYVLGAIISVGLLVAGKVNRNAAIPFGTFLTVATIITMFAGEMILDWYLGFFVNGF
jgi:prepilin signal peptidase PulO-like enzyme (type II secretory pathway)